jgi:hypothetical protein
MSAFSAPHNWCDRHCSRCRLAPICEVAQATRDAPLGGAAALHAHLEKALRMLHEIAAEQGISLDDDEPRAISERRARLLETVICVDPRTPTGMLLYAKIARVAEMCGDPLDEEVFLFDVVPNLFLIERLLDQQPPMTAARLRLELFPLQALIPPPLRAAFDTLVAAGVAPSPFCTDE